jgi:large subunit ribosomal protein L1
MAKRGKKYTKIKKNQPETALPIAKGVSDVKGLSYSSFPGTVEFHVALKIPKDKDPKSLKGSVSLPHSTGNKTVRIAVFTNKENQEAAKKAGADLFELDALIADVKAGKVDFDVAIATPDVMPQMASLGKQLGPKGLMPNPKTGTVTDDVASVVEEYKKGKLNFASDDSGVMHFPVGNVEMEDQKILENITAALEAAAEVLGKKPNQIVKKAHLAPTMGPSIEIEFDFED